MNIHKWNDYGNLVRFFLHFKVAITDRMCLFSCLFLLITGV